MTVILRCALWGATAPQSKPRRATARLHRGRASFEAPDGALRAPSLAPQDDGSGNEKTGNPSPPPITTRCLD